MDYKEKYEQALERAKYYHDRDNIQFLENIFPELAETEDERIRKWLIKEMGRRLSCWTSTEVTKEQVLAWLEKQGQDGKVWFYRDDYVRDKKQAYQDGIDNVLNNPQKYGLEKREIKEHDVCDTCDEKASCVNHCPVKLVEQKPNPCENCSIASNNCQKFPCAIRDGEQKPTDKVEPKFKIGQIIKKEGFNTGFTIAKIEDDFYYNDEGDYFPFTDQDNWELVEQKPTDKYEPMSLNEAIEHCKEKSCGNNACALEHKQLEKWLIELKELKEKKPWGEEDEQMYNTIANSLNRDQVERVWNTTEEEVDNWLKSLRHQSQWKPSKEQIVALRWILNNFPYDSHKEEISGLLEQLKKLRGE